jgi:primosomal protein N' (replication factor Y)
MVAQVLVEIKAKQVDHTFDYNVPLELQNDIKIGKRVLVPFGKQTLEGFVMGLSSTSTFDKLKDIKEVIDDEVVLNNDLLEIGDYISKKTLCTKMSALQSMLPSALKAKTGFTVNMKFETYIRLLVPDYKCTSIKQKELINILKEDKKKSELKEYVSSINTLLKKNVIEEYKVEVYRTDTNNIEADKLVKLNKEQQEVVDIVSNTDSFNPYLLFGVTGSGKTEVYMHIISNIINKGKTAIVLVPEISLTPQLVGNFHRRFGDSIAVLHSRLSNGERYDEWRKIVRGEVNIVIGARSAIFAPINNLGVIIIDEEHTPTYKQDNNPRYYAHDVALFRAKKYNIPVLFGSATPSLESFTRAKTGVYTMLRLTKRINNNLPEVKLVDMADQIKKGFKIISSDLLEALNNALELKEQAIILLNRRGYSTVITCHSCGYKVVCPNCDIPLTYHKKSNTMKCHYCDYTTYKPLECPECHSKDINQFGLGTEKLEEELSKLLPSARILRMDIDTTTRKGSHEKIFNDFKNYKYDILVGTQMISKGLDFDNVTLVGVVNGDASLNIPDFRSSERTFSLLNQVAGRAGRGSKKGKVIIQGFNLNHFSILKAKIHDYEGFYDEEMEIRKNLKYPPFYNLAVIKIIGNNQDLCFDEGNKIVRYLRNNLDNTIVLGPSTDYLPKINNNYFVLITIKYKQSKHLYEALKFINEKYINKKVKIEIDINPIK